MKNAENTSKYNQTTTYSVQTNKSYSPFEIMFISVTSVALGVAYWAWTFAYELLKPLLKVFGLNYLSAGFWIFASIFIPLVIRKPGVAILASVISAGVEGVLTHWGPMALIWGLAQGLGAEIIFALFRYKKYDLMVLILASTISTTFSYTLDYFIYDYSQLSLKIQILQFVSFLISSVVLAALLAKILYNKLNRLNLIQRFQN